MVDIRVSAASGTSTDWAASTLILGVGQFAWETDTRILRIGDGVNREPNLDIAAQVSAGSVQIDDDIANVSGSVVWSALNSQSQDAAVLASANRYTDSALQGVLNGVTPRFDVAFQNSDGTWGNRPSAYCVFAFTTGGSTTPPSWLATGIDALFIRS